MVRALIIGGTGCVGTEIINWLTKYNKADAVFSLSRGEKPASLPEGVTSIKGDIRNKDTLIDAIQQNEITHILHAAAMRTRACEEKPHLGELINVQGTRNVFEAAASSETIQRVVFMSTAAVYDQVYNQSENINENDSVKEYAPYVTHKLKGEEIARTLSAKSDFQAVILRPQILFGPSRGEEGSTAGVTNAIKAAARGEKYTIPFSGRYTFHFTGDAAPLIGGTLLNQLNDKHLTLNLPGKSMSVRDITRMVNEMAGEDLVTFQEKQYPFAKSISHKLYEKKMGPAPVTKLRPALQQSFDYFKTLPAEQTLSEV